jgi:hypothetical protein
MKPPPPPRSRFPLQVTICFNNPEVGSGLPIFPSGVSFIDGAVYLVLLVQLVEGVVKVVEPRKRIAALGWVNWKKMALILKYKVGLKYLLKPIFITQILHTNTSTIRQDERTI